MVSELFYDHSAAMERMLSVTGCKTQQDLAVFFGIRQSSISDANRRRSIPAGWLLTLLREKGVNPEWVIGGHCAPYMLTGWETAENGTVCAGPRACPLEEFSTEQLVEELLNRVRKNLAL